MLSYSLMRIFASEGLDDGTFYRLKRFEIPGLLDPLSPIQHRTEVVDELTSPDMALPEVSCNEGSKECIGSYNYGACQALGDGHYSPGPEHQGRKDEPFLPEAGDFFLTSWEALNAVGGYPQVPSTTHLDSMLVCRARGAGMRQVVLMRPCVLTHQRHPAPMQALRFIYPGWELTNETCSAVTDEVLRFFGGDSIGSPPSCWKSEGEAGDLECGGKRGWGRRSMNLEWGFPRQHFEEALVQEASLESGDWQALSLLPPWAEFPQVAIPPRPGTVQSQKFKSGEYVWRRAAALWQLASLRFHSGRGMVNRWCAFETFSRWSSERMHITVAAAGILASQTCRDDWEQGTSHLMANIPSAIAEAGRVQTSNDEDILASIIMVGKLDDKRGDSISRMQNSIDIAFEGFKKHGIRGEIILVEWVPVTFHTGGQQLFVPLSQLIRVRANPSIKLRVLTVYGHLIPHTSPGWMKDETRFWEFSAKNVGARRARGKWLLLTNSDILLPASFFQSLKTQQLENCLGERPCYFRALGADVPGIIDPQATLKDRIYMIERLEDILGKDYQCSANFARTSVSNCSSNVKKSRARDFTLIPRDSMWSLGGYMEVAAIVSSSGEQLELDEALLCSARGAGIEDGGDLPIPTLIMHQEHPRPWQDDFGMTGKVGLSWGETSEQLCKYVENEMRVSFEKAEGLHSNLKVQPGWGLPNHCVQEKFANEVGFHDWQWLSIAMAENGDEAASDFAQEASQRVIVCIASTEARVSGIQETLLTVLNQSYTPDALYVSLPNHVDPPAFIKESGATIVTHDIDADLGPVHKVLDCAKMEKNPETIIVTLDDDILVHHELLQRLVASASVSFCSFFECKHNFFLLTPALSDWPWAVAHAGFSSVCCWYDWLECA